MRNGNRVNHAVAERLAEAQEAIGNLSNAIHTLETVIKEGLGLDAEHMWIQSRAQLAGLYRKSGQEVQARALEAQLLKLLELADADHPLLRQLKSRP